MRECVMEMEQVTKDNKELLNMFLNSMRYDRLSDRTIELHENYIGRFLKTLDKPVYEVTKAVVDKYIYELKTADGGKMNVDTKNLHFSTIKRFFNFIYNSDEPEIMSQLYYIDKDGTRMPRKNPVENSKSLTNSASAKAERNPRKMGLTEEDVVKLLRVMKNTTESKTLGRGRILTATRDYTMTILMIELGLRVSDVTALNKSNFDFEKGTVTFQVKKNKDVMTLQMSNELSSALRKYFKLRNDDCDVAFATSTCGRVLDREVNAMLSRYQKKAGIEQKISAHILRHTCGSMMYKRTHNIMMVKELLGHKSITSTQIYSLNDELNDELAEKSSNITNGILAKL